MSFIRNLLGKLNIFRILRERKEQRAEEERIKKRIEELRKRDPFIYK